MRRGGRGAHHRGSGHRLRGGQPDLSLRNVVDLVAGDGAGAQQGVPGDGGAVGTRGALQIVHLICKGGRGAGGVKQGKSHHREAGWGKDGWAEAPPVGSLGRSSTAVDEEPLLIQALAHGDRNARTWWGWRERSEHGDAACLVARPCASACACGAEPLGSARLAPGMHVLGSVEETVLAGLLPYWLTAMTVNW